MLLGLAAIVAITIYANSGRDNSPISDPADANVAGTINAANSNNAVPELSSEAVQGISTRWAGESVWLSRSIVGAKDLETLKKIVETLRDNDGKAFAILVLRGDAIKLSKGTKVTVSTIPRADGTYLSVRPEGSPDEFWVLREWLQ